jgi:hypothetical protein
MPAYRLLDFGPNATVMSAVMSPPGTIALRVHVCPPSVETNTGASVELGPIGFGVNAVATSCCGLFGLTASIGSLSCSLSPLSEFGMMLTSNRVAAMRDLAFRRD